MPRTRPLLAAAAALTLAAVAACSSGGAETGETVLSSECTPVAAAAGGAAPAATAYGVPAPSAGVAEYGQDPNNPDLYRGPNGFCFDVTSCPEDWNVDAGISATGVNLFTSMPFSGPLAPYGYIGTGIGNYFDHVNANGGIGGKQVTFDVKDDQYQPDLTRKNVDDAIASGNYAASFASVGTANNGAVRDVMNSECMGQFLVGSSDPKWGDPQNYPWTTGMGLDYYSESNLWARFLEQKFPQGGRIEIVHINNDFGKTYVAGLQRALQGSNLTIAETLPHDPQAPNLDNQITTAAASNADALVLITAGTFCAQGLAAVEKSAWNPVVVTGNSCAQISTTFTPLTAQGLTGNGTNVVRYYYAPTDPDAEDQQFATLMTDQLRAGGLDPAEAQYANGWFWGWYIASVLQNASQMRGGLNRANILVASYTVDQEYPMLVSGVTSVTAGNDDAYLFESGQVYSYADGGWTKQGQFISNEGKQKNWTSLSGG